MNHTTPKQRLAWAALGRVVTEAAMRDAREAWKANRNNETAVAADSAEAAYERACDYYTYCQTLEEHE